MLGKLFIIPSVIPDLTIIFQPTRDGPPEQFYPFGMGRKLAFVFDQAFRAFSIPAGFNEQVNV
jgi:hypothetical protein